MNDSQALALPQRRSSFAFGAALIVVVALLGLLTWTFTLRAAPPLNAGSAPAFELKTFDGQSLTLASLRGKPIILNFWASWCNPCKEEAPLLQAVWAQYRSQGLMLLGVDYVDTEPEALKYLKDFGITYPNGPDLGTRISKTYRITGVPETYFITREGTLLAGSDANARPYANWIGPIPASALQERVQKLLAP